MPRERISFTTSRTDLQCHTVSFDGPELEPRDPYIEPCAAPGCENLSTANGYCELHQDSDAAEGE